MKAWILLLLLVACSTAERRLTPYEEAKEAERKGDIAGAIEKYRKAIEKEPENITVHREYQNLMRRAKRFDEVRMEYKFRMENNSGSALWLYLYGRLLDGKEMEGLMQRSIAADSAFVWAHHALALYYTNQNRWKDALRHLEYILAQGRTPEEGTRINAAVCYMNLGDDARAEEQLTLARQEFPGSANPIFHMGILHFNQKKFDLAAAELEEALQKDPRYFKAFGPLSQTYHVMGQKDQAARARQRARDFYRKTPEPEMAKEFMVILEKQDGWGLSVWEKLAVEINSPLEKGNWIYLARMTRPDNRVMIQYTLTRTEALKFILVRSVVDPSTRRDLEAVDTTELSEKDEFDNFYRRVLRDTEALRKKY